MKLLKLFRKKPFCNDFHLLLIPILIFLLSLKYWPFFIVLGLYFIYLIKKTRLIFVSLLLILSILLEIMCLNLLHKIKVENEINTYVYDVSSKDSYTIFYKGALIQVKEWDHENKPGDYIVLSIELDDALEKSYDTDFDYQEYLYSKGISYSAKGKTIKRNKSYFSIYSIKYYYMSYLEKHLSKESYSYVSAMVFGENTLEDSIKDAYSILGISHILAISGLHILFLYKVISFLLLKLFKYYKKGIPIALLISYSLLIGAPPSALRALLFVLLGTWNQKGEVAYTRLDILSISCIGMLFMNPYQIYSTGFLLSYLVSFVLIFINKGKARLRNAYKSYILIYFSTLPLVINITNKISFLSFLLSPIFSLILSFILLPISYLLAVFPILDYGLKYLFIFLNTYLENLTAYNLSIAVPSFSIWNTMLYYLLFVFFIILLSMKRKIYLPLILISIYLSCFINIRYMNPYYRVTYMDCGQGDACLIELPNGRGTMLIDAYNSYDYIKSLGYRDIDILLFTHSDSDHVGDYLEILKNMRVKEIYAPKYDLVFDTLMPNIQINKIESGDILYLKDLKIDILGPINPYSDPNSNSIVLSFQIEGLKYMFTGDMTKNEEFDLLDKYGNSLDSDILKVAHHGSDTSSTVEFLSAISPKISIISVAKKNTYGLPVPYIVKRIEGISKVYMTYECGNITIKQGFGKVHITTYR